MATVNYWSSSWAASGADVEDELKPNDVHSYIMWGFGDGDAITITAHPGHAGGSPLRPPLPVEQFLAVENVRTEWNPNGRRVFFDVRNASTSYSVFGYVIGFAFVSG